MTSSLNEIVNYEIIATDNVTIFNERVFPLMNITLTAANTTITSALNGVILPLDTIYVTSTDNFPSSGGSLTIIDSNGSETITYTGISGNSFTGCSGGTGTLSTGDIVYLQVTTSWLVFPDDAPFTATITSQYLLSPFSALLASAFGSDGSLVASPNTVVASGSDGYIAGNFTINVASTTNFPAAGSIYLDTAYINYTGITGTSFTGCTSGSYSNVISTGDDIFNIPGALINYNSNNAALPQSVINVDSTTGFPTSGYILVESGAGDQIVSYTGTTPTSFTGCSGGTGTLSTDFTVLPQQTYVASGLTLPQSVIPSGSTAGFPNSGSIIIVIDNVSPTQYQIVNYTSITGGGSPSFNGCTGGTQSVLSSATIISNIGQETTVASSSNDQIIGNYTLDLVSTAGFPTSGTIHIIDTTGTEILTYTGISGNTLTGVTGGTGTFTSGSNGLTLPQSVIKVVATNSFAPSGSVVIRTATGDELVSYTGIDSTGTELIGASGGTTTLATDNVVFPYPSPIFATINAGSDGQILSSVTPYDLYISPPGYLLPFSGTIYVNSTAGQQEVTYTGQVNIGTYAVFYSCLGGTGTIATGNAVQPYASPTYCTVAADSNGYTLSASPTSTIYVADTTGFPSAAGSPEYDSYLIINDTQVGNPSAGDDNVYYTGTTSTTFSGVTGGVGILSTGDPVANYGTQATPVSPSIGEALPQGTINVDSTAGFPPVGAFAINTAYAFPIIISYTSLTSTSFLGCTLITGGGSGSTITSNAGSIYQAFTGVASASNEVVLPTGTIYATSTDGFPATGNLIILTSTGFQIVGYTSVTGGGTPSFNGCTGGSGFMSTGTNNIQLAYTTTVAANSNGQDLTQDTIYVTSTAGFAPSGGFYIFDSANSGAGEFVYYESLTATSFNGCTGGTGTLTAGDKISNYGNSTITAADPVSFPFTSVLTGANDVTNITAQPYILIGNSADSNDSTTTNSVTQIISSTSVGFDSEGSVPDDNNGSLIWALTNYVYTGDELIQAGVSNRVQFFVSNGYNLLLTQESQDQWALDTDSVGDGFNVITLSGNLESVDFSSSSTFEPFSVAVQVGSQFSTVLENNAGYTMTFGYTSDGSTFSSSTITVANGDAVFVFGDGENVFTPLAVAANPIPVEVSSNYGPILDPSGTTYLIGYQGLTLTLPSAPPDGTFYIFKDGQGVITIINPFTIESSGSDTLFLANGVYETNLDYTTPYLSFTLQYFATDLIWRVINKTDNELSPIWVVTGGVAATDPRQQDYIIDTKLGGATTFTTYDGANTPIDGQIFSLKDATESASGGNWSVNGVTVNTTSTNFEYPAGTVTPTPASVIIQPSGNGLYVKFRFDTLSNTWLLLETNFVT